VYRKKAFVFVVRVFSIKEAYEMIYYRIKNKIEKERF